METKMTPRFFYTQDRNGNPRHVVVATGEVDGDQVPVELVGFHPSVQGSSRKGRKPNLVRAALSELVEMQVSEVPEDLYGQAERLLASAAGGTDANVN